MTPREVDTELAALYGRVLQLRQKIALSESSALSQAGAEWYYRGKQRVTDMKVAEAEEILARHVAAHAATSDPDGPNYDYGYALVGRSNIGQIRSTVESLSTNRALLAETLAEMREKELAYTGWSRFFLVTSSKGHIHSSMHCSTCRFTTTYGWLPEISGRTEGDCVAEFGPALCTVCFPTAPLEWTLSEITKAQAETRAA